MSGNGLAGLGIAVGVAASSVILGKNILFPKKGLENEISEAEKQIKKLISERNVILAELEKLRAELAAYKERAAENSEESEKVIASLQIDLDNAFKEIKSNEKRLVALDTELKTVNNELIKKQEELRLAASAAQTKQATTNNNEAKACAKDSKKKRSVLRFGRD